MWLKQQILRELPQFINSSQPSTQQTETIYLSRRHKQTAITPSPRWQNTDDFTFVTPKSHQEAAETPSLSEAYSKCYYKYASWR